MDLARARRMTNELTGRSVGGWTLQQYLGAGKSALVFRGLRGEQEGAVKIFDPELVERFGHDVQLGRIKRELQLRGREHPNLVKILDGGESDGHFYVAMELVDAPSLGTLLDRIPRERIWSLIGQVADAAEFLESCSLVHRDIKPDNIALGSNLEHPVLLDLGVIRPIGLGDLTDEDDKRPFVATLRYSPPELLVRAEDDTVDGWRAVTFYQLGAVLYDLIMRHPLFRDYGEPYALLADAVRSKVPVVEANDVSPDLILLAANCLIKDPKLRLQLVSWASFQPRSPGTPALDAKARMEKRLAAKQVQAAEGSVERERSVLREQRAIAEVQGAIERAVRQECTGNPLFPPLETSQRLIHGGALFCVCFGSSATLGLDKYAQVSIRVSLLDEQARVVEISAAVGLSQDRSPRDVEGTPFTALHKGVFNEAVIAPILKDLLYTTIDRAQQHLADDCPSNAVDGIKWWPTLVSASRGGV